MISIPRRKIDTKLQSVPATSVGDLPHYVAMSTAPITMLHRMAGITRGPETKAVVMFGRENQSFHSRGFCRLDDLVGVEIGGIENPRLFISIAPFFVGEGVYREVKKTVKLQLMPAKLTGGRRRSERRRR